MSLFGSQTIGVDITHKSVRVVGLKGHSRPSLVGCKEISLDDEAITKDGIHDIEYVTKIIKQAMGQASPKPLTGKRAITAIPELQLFRKVIELPILPSERDTMGAIRSEIAQFLPDEIEQTEIAYQVLGQFSDTKMQQIMVVAVSKKIVEQYQQVCKAAGLEVAAIDVRTSALGRATIPSQEKKGTVLVNLETDATTISLYQGGAVRVTSSLPTGVGENDKKEISPRFLTDLADEIDHVVKFYSNRTPEHSELKEVSLTGPGAVFEDLRKSLEKQVQLPLGLAKPVITVPAFCDRRFLVAIGCAMYPLGEGA